MAELRIANIADQAHTELLTQSDKEYISTLVAAKRRSEVSAWRALLRHTLIELGREADAQSEIQYDEVGAPYITGSAVQFSVSHSSTLVAVLLSDVKCAVDIESLERSYCRIAKKYVAPFEATLSDNELLLPIIWSAKETLYKLAGRRELDMINDLKINIINDSIVSGSITPHSAQIEMRYSVVQNHIIVYTA